MMRPSISAKGIVVADDLTGACDCGAAFARAGLQTQVVLCEPLPKSEGVLVISTNSRRLLPSEAFCSVQRAAERLPIADAEIVFKKVDSTLRGNVIAECAALLAVTHATVAVIAPALPALGRLVRQGVLHVEDLTGSWSIDIRQIMKKQGALVEFVSPSSLAESIAAASLSSPYLVCDAESDHDLACIAATLLQSTKKVLWVGSAGLASHAAPHLARKEAPSTTIENNRDVSSAERPVLFCVGSTHPVTARQLDLLQRARRCGVLTMDATSAASLFGMLDQGRHIVLRLDTQRDLMGALQLFFRDLPAHRIGGIFITGGDTATLICTAAGACGLRLTGQVQEGVVTGLIEGGIFDAMPIAMKSGGFGTEDCLVQSVDVLNRLPRLKETQAYD